MSQDVAEQNIQMWKVKKLIKSLDSARGCFFLGQKFSDIHFWSITIELVLRWSVWSYLQKYVENTSSLSRCECIPNAPGSNISCFSHVDAGVRNRFEYQVSCQSVVCIGSHNQYSAAPEIVQSCATQWSRAVCRHDPDRWREGEKSFFRFWTS